MKLYGVRLGDIYMYYSSSRKRAMQYAKKFNHEPDEVVELNINDKF